MAEKKTYSCLCSSVPEIRAVELRRARLDFLAGESARHN